MRCEQGFLKGYLRQNEKHFCVIAINAEIELLVLG